MRLAVCLTLVASGLAVLAAQPQQPIRVGTNFVRVDAYPTKDGRIVEGLQAADFEVLEDGVPQKIESFEHVVATIGPHSARTEPSSQREMIQALANPRNRVFLIFLDSPYVDWESAYRITEPLIGFMRKYLADDDLVALMTPGMSATQVVFVKKTKVIEEGLKGTWSWGRQNRELDPELDKRQIQYGLCYPGAGDVGAKMAARSRERATLEALQDVVKYLESLREERKAIVTVTQGWILYREDPDLMRKREKEQPIGNDKIRVGPTGKLTLEDHRNSVNALPPNQCDADRAYLAGIDNEKFLRDIIDDANRGNASFYMIDPSGLTVERRSERRQAMQTLAENTDGLTVLHSNDLNRGFDRIASDMSSYYLLGYYASNTKPDGRFREIAVRVKQPGVAVRARKGYRAPTAGEITVARRAVEGPASSAAATPVRAAIDRLSRIRPNARLRINAVVGPGPRPSLWVAGEVQSTGSRPDEFMQGGKAAIEAIAGDKSTTASATLKSGELAFLVRLEMPAATSGVLDVRVRLASDEGTAEPLSEGLRVELGANGPQALMFRRGVTTGNRLLPAADPEDQPHRTGTARDSHRTRTSGWQARRRPRARSRRPRDAGAGRGRRTDRGDDGTALDYGRRQPGAAQPW